MGWVVNATPQPLYPRERPGTHCGPQSGCGFDPRTAQPVASQYTDCTIPAHTYHKNSEQNSNIKV